MANGFDVGFRAVLPYDDQGDLLVRPSYPS
jgi:hypothetical protein